MALSPLAKLVRLITVQVKRNPAAVPRPGRRVDGARLASLASLLVAEASTHFPPVALPT